MGHRTGMRRATTETYLDTSEAQNASLLALEPLVDLVRVVAVHVRLGHEREGDAVVELAELGDLLVVLRLLATELRRGAAQGQTGLRQREREDAELTAR